MRRRGTIVAGSVVGALLRCAVESAAVGEVARVVYYVVIVVAAAAVVAAGEVSDADEGLCEWRK